MKTAILKLSGKALPEVLSNKTWMDVIFELKKKYDGIIIVHGAGKDITEWSEKLGFEAQFIDGQRVTTKNVMNVVAAVQSGMINGQLVAHLLGKGIESVGLTGADRNLFVTKTENELLGQVGVPVLYGKTEWINHLLGENVIPVFSSVCRNINGELINVNADIFTETLAEVMKAESVYFISDIKGVRIDGAICSCLTKTKIENHIDDGQITDGMIPKLRSSAQLLDHGVGKIWIGSPDPSDLLGILTGENENGTWIVPEKEIVYG